MYPHGLFFDKVDDSCGGCYYTNDHLFEKTATGIILDMTEYAGLTRFHNYGYRPANAPDTSDRAQNQYWIAYPRESAAKGFGLAENLIAPDENGNNMDSAFNLTLSLRRDSDIVAHPTVHDVLMWTRYKNPSKLNEDGSTYGTLIDTDQEHLDRILKNKYKDRSKNYIFWIISNCGRLNIEGHQHDTTPGAIARFDYATGLIKKGLKVDAYGKCFKDFKRDHQIHALEAALQNEGKESGRVKQPWNQIIPLVNQYKFYLDFENGIHCKDYLSEKFWRNSLMAYMVPVIFGTHKSDCLALAPKNSFIHVDDFKTQDELIDYLNYLNYNDTAYMSYHQWRVTTKVDTTQPPENHSRRRICGTCKMLKAKQAENYPIRMIKSYSSWWWINTHDNQCVNGTTVAKFLRDIDPPVSMEDNWWDELQQVQKMKKR